MTATLNDFPDPNRDDHWVRQNLAAGARWLDEVPLHFRTATVDHPDVLAWVEELVRHAAETRHVSPRITTGPSLLLIGLTGRGKTHQAYGALRALAASGVRPNWEVTTAANLYAALRPRQNHDVEAAFLRHAEAPVLMLDDLGAAKGSEWTEEVNYRLINHRYEHHLPTLITSNVPTSALAGELGERVTSRLIEMTQVVVLRGDDRRRGREAS